MPHFLVSLVPILSVLACRLGSVQVDWRFCFSYRVFRNCLLDFIVWCYVPLKLVSPFYSDWLIAADGVRERETTEVIFC